MRIALLVSDEGAPKEVAAKLSEHLAAGSSRVIVVGVDGVLAESLSWAARVPRDSPGRTSVVVLAPLAAEAIDEGSLRALVAMAEGGAGGEAGATDRVSFPDEDGTIDRRIEAALQSFDEGHLDAAREQLARIDVLLGAERSPRRAEVLHRLGAIAKSAGNLDESAHWLDLALALVPNHVGALRDRIEVARAAGDVSLGAAMRRRSLEHATTDEARVRTLALVADDALAAAIEAMRSALALKPNHRALLGRLRAVYEASGDFPHAVDAAVALAEATQDRMERARAFVAAADLCAEGGKNVGRAVALYEAAIADDPTVPGAFEAIESVLLANEDWSRVEKAYERQLDRLQDPAAAGAPSRGATAAAIARREAERALLHKLAAVRWEKLHDFPRAVQALDRLVVMDPDDVDTRAKLAALLEENGQDALAGRCLEIVAVKAPTRADTYHAMRRVALRANDAERAYLACAALVSLGEADVDEQRVYQHFAPKVALQPKQPLDDASWQRLHPDDHDHALSAVFAAIAPTVVTGKLEEMRARGQLPRLDAKAKQDVEQSTVMAVRTVGWAAKLLGIGVPAIYARADEVAHGIALVPALEPTVAIGKALLSGRSVPELTFRIAWELAYERVTGRVLQLYPSLAELTKIVVAAIGLVVPTSNDPEVKALSASMGKRLDARRRAALEAAVTLLTARGGTLDLLGWVRSIERTACRVGLLACGDVGVASRILASDPRPVAGLSASDRIRDLMSFSVSEAHVTLRRALGVAATGPIPAATVSNELDVVIDVGLDL